MHLIAAAKVISPENLTCIEMANKIVSKFVKISIVAPTSTATSTTATIPQAISTLPLQSTSAANLYAMELVTLALLWYGFHDAVREGDGDWIL